MNQWGKTLTMNVMRCILSFSASSICRIGMEHGLELSIIAEKKSSELKFKWQNSKCNEPPPLSSYRGLDPEAVLHLAERARVMRHARNHAGDGCDCLEHHCTLHKRILLKREVKNK